MLWKRDRPNEHFLLMKFAILSILLLFCSIIASAQSRDRAWINLGAGISDPEVFAGSISGNYQHSYSLYTARLLYTGPSNYYNRDNLDLALMLGPSYASESFIAALQVGVGYLYRRESLTETPSGVNFAQGITGGAFHVPVQAQLIIPIIPKSLGLGATAFGNLGHPKDSGVLLSIIVGSI